MGVAAVPRSSETATQAASLRSYEAEVAKAAKQLVLQRSAVLVALSFLGPQKGPFQVQILPVEGLSLQLWRVFLGGRIFQ